MDKHSLRIPMIRILISLGVGLSLLFIVASHSAVTMALSSEDTVIVSTDVHNSLALKTLSEPDTQTLNANPLTVTLPYSIYLPLIRNYRPPSGIYGTVTDNRVPAEGASLLLNRYTGSSFTTIQTTTTQTDGSFAFTTAPSLVSGQSYVVVFWGSTSSHIGYWATKQIDTYAVGSTVHIGDFDIAKIELLTPTDGVSVTLPYTFQWTPRAAELSDNYQFYMPGGGYFSSPPLGYTGSFILTTLPAGFNVGQSYYWSVSVFHSDGSRGFSYEARQVSFNNGGLRR